MALEVDSIAQRYGRLPADIIDETHKFPPQVRYEFNFYVHMIGLRHEQAKAAEFKARMEKQGKK